MITKPEVHKMDLKTKIIVVVCIICSLIAGLTAMGLYINYTIAAEGNYAVTERMLMDRAMIIPLAFFLGYIISIIAIPLFYICRFVE